MSSGNHTLVVQPVLVNSLLRILLQVFNIETFVNFDTLSAPWYKLRVSVTCRNVSHVEVFPVCVGGAPLGGLYGETNEHELVGVVRTAIQKGINFIDTAPFYGHRKSESVLGKVSVMLQS